jgi:hypothetical protein
MKALEALDDMNGTNSQREENYEAKLKKEFGNMMPRSGVYFMPDFKVISFIR